MDPKALDDLSRRLVDAMPSGFRQVQEDLQKTFTAVLQSALSRMNLVTREEFDVQAGVLAKTRAKLKALEEQVTELEVRVLPTDKTAASKGGAGRKQPE